MTCYFPLHCFKGPIKDNGKMTVLWKAPAGTDRLDLPCGRCVGCLMAYSKGWAIRCLHEASLYDWNCFITLTYDDKNLPYGGSLDKAEFSDFMKRLRKRFGVAIRFFACGEYGPVHLRPHYHALIFNHDFDDRVLYKETEAGSPVYLSAELQKLWTKGYSSVSDVNIKSAGYVARYNLKKALNPVKLPDYLSREFVNMSRGSKKLGTGGIGKGWYDKFKGDVFPSDQVVLSGGKVMKPPRFYDNLLDKEDPDLLELIKLERSKGHSWIESCLDRQMVKEEVFRAGLSQLKRTL